MIPEGATLGYLFYMGLRASEVFSNTSMDGPEFLFPANYCVDNPHEDLKGFAHLISEITNTGTSFYFPALFIFGIYIAGMNHWLKMGAREEQEAGALPDPRTYTYDRLLISLFIGVFGIIPIVDLGKSAGVDESAQIFNAIISFFLYFAGAMSVAHQVSPRQYNAAQERKRPWYAWALATCNLISMLGFFHLTYQDAKQQLDKTSIHVAGYICYCIFLAIIAIPKINSSPEKEYGWNNYKTIGLSVYMLFTTGFSIYDKSFDGALGSIAFLPFYLYTTYSASETAIDLANGGFKEVWGLGGLSHGYCDARRIAFITLFTAITFLTWNNTAATHVLMDRFWRSAGYDHYGQCHNAGQFFMLLGFYVPTQLGAVALNALAWLEISKTAITFIAGPRITPLIPKGADYQPRLFAGLKDIRDRVASCISSCSCN